MKTSRDKSVDVVGLLPAGGSATRVAPLPCSKEIFPIGFRSDPTDRGLKVKVVSHYLLDRMRESGIRKAYFIIRDNKWDIPRYYGDGSMANMHIGYLMMGVPYGTPFTLNQAYPFVSDKIIALGFPDILFSPKNAYSVILEKLSGSKADVVLGLFKTDKPDKMDMVDIDSSGAIREIVIKPEKTALEYTWTVAVWKPRFSEFMNGYLNDLLNSADSNADFTGIVNGRELYVGDVFIAALGEGLSIDAVPFPDGFTMDIGTPEDLRRAISMSHDFDYNTTEEKG